MRSTTPTPLTFSASVAPWSIAGSSNSNCHKQHGTRHPQLLRRWRKPKRCSRKAQPKGISKALAASRLVSWSLIRAAYQENKDTKKRGARKVVDDSDEDDVFEVKSVLKLPIACHIADNQYQGQRKRQRLRRPELTRQRKAMSPICSLGGTDDPSI